MAVLAHLLDLLLVVAVFAALALSVAATLWLTLGRARD